MAAVSRLTKQISDEKASGLATEAIALAKSGKLDVSQPQRSDLEGKKKRKKEKDY